MNRMRFLRKIFRRGENESTDRVQTNNEVVEEKKPFNYGMMSVAIGLASNDYGWNEPVELPKHYILRDIDAYKEKVTVMGLVSAWRGTGHSEWEFLLAGIFISNLLEAWEAGQKEVDITTLFDRDLLASNNHVFTKEQVKDHIIKIFTVEEEDNENIYLRLNVAA